GGGQARRVWTSGRAELALRFLPPDKRNFPGPTIGPRPTSRRQSAGVVRPVRPETLTHDECCGFPSCRQRSSHPASQSAFFPGMLPKYHRNRIAGLLMCNLLSRDDRHKPGDDPMKKLLFAGAMLASFAAIQSASAADLALKAPPPPPIVDEWTGWYVGWNLGGSFGRSSTTYTGIGFAPFTTSQHLDGVVGGGQVG